MEVVGVRRAMISWVQILILNQDLVDFTSLLAQLQGMSKASVVGFKLLGCVVHRDHVFLGLLKGAGHGEELGFEMIHTSLQVLIFHLEAGELVRGAGGTIRNQALDDFLNAVAAL